MNGPVFLLAELSIFLTSLNQSANPSEISNFLSRYSDFRISTPFFSMVV